MNIASAGEILWDLVGGEEYLGGAPLNFAVSAHRLGSHVTLVSAVGNDARGDRALARIEALGLSTAFVRRVPHPTGTVTIHFDESGEPGYVIHRPAAYDFLEPAAIEAQWIYFGTLIQTNLRARAAIAAINRSIPNRFYDLNLRKNSYTPELVRELIGESTAIKMNQQEASILGATSNLEAFCRSFEKRYVCVTRGAAGCALLIDGDYAEVDAIKVQVADTIGAGDAFAAAFLHGIGEGWSAEEVGRYANRAGSLVASRPGAIPDWSSNELNYQSARIPI
ncbi:MAG TPA: PfkB family carbohydrate kinase [Bryobacteraceae bacterium]|nr:PfkB family carbohydrate kinase [Bryobacteraceae bacterium]